MSSNPSPVRYLECNDVTRTVTTRDNAGVIINQRPYTDTENADADARAIQATNEDTLTTNAQGAIAALNTILSDLQAIAAKADTAITPADTKLIATRLVQLTKQIARLTRLAVNQYDATI